MTDVEAKSTGSKGAWKGYVIVLVAAMALYVITCAPGLVWQDSGVIQYRVLTRDIEGKLGLALSHPLYYLISIGTSLIPLGDFAHRVNLTTAVISAFAVANLFLLLRVWTGRNSPAIVGALTLAVSHTFWRHATIPETYNLTAALLFGELLVLLLYGRTGRIGYLYALALLSGLGVANHMLASIAMVCYLVLVAVLAARGQIRLSQVAVMAGLWVLGALPLEVLFFKELTASGDLGATVASALFGTKWQDDVLNASITWRIVAENVMWMGLNFPTPNVLLILVGAVTIFKGARGCWFHRIVAVLLILYLAFAFRYTVEDRYAFFIPFYCIAAVFVGVGTLEMVERFTGKGIVVMLVLFSLLAIPAYIVAPKLADSMNVFNRRRQVPYRDDAAYFLRPWRTGYHGADTFAQEALAMVERDSVIMVDGTTGPPLLFTQLHLDKRPDVTVTCSLGRTPGAEAVNRDNIEQVLDERPVYVVSAVEGYCPKYLLEMCEFENLGLLSKAVRKKETEQ